MVFPDLFYGGLYNGRPSWVNGSYSAFWDSNQWTLAAEAQDQPCYWNAEEDVPFPDAVSAWVAYNGWGVPTVLALYPCGQQIADLINDNPSLVYLEDVVGDPAAEVISFGPANLTGGADRIKLPTSVLP